MLSRRRRQLPTVLSNQLSDRALSIHVMLVCIMIICLRVNYYDCLQNEPNLIGPPASAESQCDVGQPSTAPCQFGAAAALAVTLLTSAASSADAGSDAARQASGACALAAAQSRTAVAVTAPDVIALDDGTEIKLAGVIGARARYRCGNSRLAARDCRRARSRGSGGRPNRFHSSRRPPIRPLPPPRRSRVR